MMDEVLAEDWSSGPTTGLCFGEAECSAELDRKFEQAVSELLDATIIKESLADLQAELDALWSAR